MCDSPQKLVAWMDGELTDNESVDVERHVRNCSECQSSVEAYEDVTRLFGTYCDATATETRLRRKRPRWVPVLSGAVAAAVLLLMLHPASVKQVRLPVHLTDASAAMVVGTAPTQVKVKKLHRPRPIAPLKSSRANWAFADPTIQIAIPAEAMFPPGAVPEGITFIADLSMASDGSVQGLRLQQ